MHLRWITTFLLALALVACSKQVSEDEVKFTKIEMMAKAKETKPLVELILPKDMTSGVRCVNDAGALIYGPGCVAGFLVKYKTIDFAIVEFTDTAHARAEAVRLDQFYAANWLFDDVMEEPELEDYVFRAFGAKPGRPRAPTPAPTAPSKATP